MARVTADGEDDAGRSDTRADEERRFVPVNEHNFDKQHYDQTQRPHKITCANIGGVFQRLDQRVFVTCLQCECKKE